MDLESEPAVQALIPLKTKFDVQSYTLMTQVINTVGRCTPSRVAPCLGCHFRIAAEALMGFGVSYLSFSDEQYLKAASNP
jgi:hypothetical protein